jgi:hypothetical protein
VFLDVSQYFRPDHHKHNKVQLYDLINPNVLINTRIYPITQALLTYKYPNTHNTHWLEPSVRWLVTSLRSQLSASHTHSSVPLSQSSHHSCSYWCLCIALTGGGLSALGVSQWVLPSLPLNWVRSLPPLVPPSLTHSHTGYWSTQ